MRICVYGAGASGGHFAVKLAEAGHEVSVIARGAHLAAIAAGGLTLTGQARPITAQVRASETAAALGPQDAVIVGVKATGLASVAAGIGPLLGPGTLVVFPQNGIPWWYPRGLPPGLPKPPDLPGFGLADRFLSRMTQDQVIGALIYSANRIEAPGIVRNNSPAANRIEIGRIERIEIGAAEPAGLAGLRGAFEEAGIACEAVGDIREAVWLKLLANMSGSAIALATGNESSVSRKDPALGEVYLRVLREGLAISAAHGYRLDHRIEPEAALARTLDHRPSLVQDYEQRRPMEIGEIVLGPQAFARAAGLATPSLDVLAAIVTRLARDRGLYPSP